jgi:hypothetical protein
VNESIVEKLQGAFGWTPKSPAFRVRKPAIKTAQSLKAIIFGEDLIKVVVAYLNRGFVVISAIIYYSKTLNRKE